MKDAGSTGALSPFEPLVARIASLSAVDGPADALARTLRKVIPKGAVKDAISGTWLGHALHPALTDVVVGSFLSATAVDLIAGRNGRVASQRLLMLGIAAYGPTALAGASDWADGAVDERVRRVGAVHAGGNLLALTLYARSLAARRRGAHLKGALLAGAGSSVLVGGAFLGGHLSLRLGIGPDQTVFDPGTEDWSQAIEAAQLVEGRPARVVVGDTPVLLVRTAARTYAIHDRCSHRGCSLAEGEVSGHEVVCSCHGSRFDLEDGALLGGPATAPQPAYEVRELDGTVEVRLPPTG
jgi:nitrite reductase/ring-hydroxylating ferredoxin subunit